MQPKTDPDTLPLAYVEDELSSSEKAAFEARLANDAALRAEVEGLRATKTLLGERARWALSSEPPPPHLLDAILQAEVAARVVRPPRVSAERNNVLRRLARFVAGGGVLAGAAAAVFFLVVRSDKEVASVSSIEDIAQPPAVKSAATKDADGQAAEAKNHPPEGAMAPPPAAAPISSSVRADKQQHDSAIPGLDAAGMKADDRAVPQAASSQRQRDEMPIAKMEQQKETETALSPASAPAPAMATAEMSETDASAQPRSAGVARESALGQTASSMQGAAKRGGGSPDSKEPPRTQKNATVDPRMEARREQKRQQAEFFYAVGMRKLAAKEYLDAWDQFLAAETLDSHRQLGAAPLYGQMQALSGLARLREAAFVAKRALGFRVTDNQVVEVLLLGAKLAEETGEVDLARSLYQRLLEVPAQKKTARAALQRLTAGPTAPAK